VAFSQGEPLGRVDSSGSLSPDRRRPATKFNAPVVLQTDHAVPKLANRTPFALVIDSLLVRTANYSIGDRDGSHPVLFDKFKNLAGNAGIVTDVAPIHYLGA
jgi:hypothetical protein